MRTLRLPASLLLLLAFAGCSSASKRAKEYMEKGLYDDAVRTYEEIVTKDPNDTDARAGLQAARSAWLDRKLIDVRMARLAGSRDSALDLLLDIFNREGLWGMEPGGKVGFTQNEESGYGMEYAEKVAAEDIAKKVPLRAEAFLLRYQKVFASGDAARRYEAARARVKAAGKASCQSFLPERPAAMKKGVDPVAALATAHPYHYSFVRRYCDYWGVGTPEPPADAERFRDVYIGSIQVSALGVTNLPSDARLYVADLAKAAIQKTAWYDPKGKQSLNLRVNGGYTYNDTRVPQSLQHVYTEQVPYTEYVDVQKSRDVPYTVVENAFDPLSNSRKERTVTKYRTEYYTEKEPQTRYRDVERIYHYGGFQHDRKLSLLLTASVAVGKEPFEVQLSEVSSTGGIESDESQPAIGLNPQHPWLEDPANWIRAESGRFVASLGEKLASLWKDTYCPGTSNENVAISGDAVHLCLRQQFKEVPGFVDAWYQKNLGVGVRDAIMILGDRK